LFTTAWIGPNLDRLFHRAVDAVGYCDVKNDALSFTAGCVDFRNRRRQRLGAASSERNLGTIAREEPREMTAEAT
jgi:hypothetical protein